MLSPDSQLQNTSSSENIPLDPEQLEKAKSVEKAINDLMHAGGVTDNTDMQNFLRAQLLEKFPEYGSGVDDFVQRMSWNEFEWCGEDTSCVIASIERKDDPINFNLKDFNIDNFRSALSKGLLNKQELASVS